MKLACQTILWGAKLDDASAMFKTIHDLGFEGVEICQPPTALPAPETLQAILEAETSKLELLGLYGGRLEDRVAYCKSFRPPFQPRYLCVEDWTEPDCQAAIEAGFKLALHPHMFKRVHNFATASQVLKDHPELLFLPDTAHLFAARNDPAEAIERHASRLAGIHMKDWTCKHGRSFHRYARGFVELGQGDVALERILHTLKSISYDGWVVFEQDSTILSPHESAQISLKWLAKHGFKVTQNQGAQLPSTVSTPRRSLPQGEAELGALVANLMDVRHLSLEQFALLVLRALHKIVDFKMASLWEYSPTTDLLSLYASDPLPSRPIQPTLDSSTDISGMAVSTQTVQFLDPYRPPPGRVCVHEAVLRQFAIAQVISVPILNSYNCNHVELIVNLHLGTAVIDTAEVNRLSTLLATCAEFIAIAYESVLEDQCQGAAATVSRAVAGVDSSADFLKKIVDFIHEFIGCEGVTIFLGDEPNQRLVPHASTGLLWRANIPPSEQYYERGKGLTGQVWESGYPQLTNHPEREHGYLGKSTEKTSDRTRTSLCVPIRDAQGTILGVIRCVNKRQRSQVQECEVFCESDLSILDAVEQVMVPNLLLLTKEATAKIQRVLIELMQSTLISPVPDETVLRVLEEVEHWQGVRKASIVEHDNAQSLEPCSSKSLDLSSCALVPDTVAKELPISVLLQQRAPYQLTPEVSLFPLKSDDAFFGVLVVQFNTDSRQHLYAWLELAALITNSCFLLSRLQIRTERLQQDIANERFKSAAGTLARSYAHEALNAVKEIESWISNAKRAAPAYDKLSQRVGELFTNITNLLQATDASRPNPRICVFNKELEAILFRMGYRHHQRIDNCELRLEIAGTKYRNVKFDPTQLSTIVTNLIINAREWYSISHRRGPITVQMCEHRIGDKDYIGFSVLDYACGIAKDKHEDVFRCGYSTKPGGSGLGLWMVRQLVEEQSEGKVLLDAKVGQYTKFTILYPIVQEDS